MNTGDTMRHLFRTAVEDPRDRAALAGPGRPL